ncbi:DUF6174 domain-containing protein [Teredinibacter turnerae]|uniref:Lipoprotein n=1 Tax=Teredinibacter turnerae (strain ATCC 39867 / T7901) TaxID=377629 RepID=C5BNQ7_TERTT|nr:DUF6174 domain-containing protein [Teredinibacter turnerae]ACR12743.1 putative lipoprotein [Teredinibacter turnerae T7901]
MNIARKATTILLPLFTSIVLLGCNGDNKDHSTKELDEARAIWSKANLSYYQFTYRRFCFCPQTEALIIEVQNNQVTSAFYTPSGTYLSDEELAYVQNIDELFDTIEELIVDQADEVTVIYNSTYGYPEQVDVDLYKNAIDDEFTLNITDFNPIQI